MPDTLTGEAARSGAWILVQSVSIQPALFYLKYPIGAFFSGSDGAVLLFVLIIYTGFTVWQARRQRDGATPNELGSTHVKQQWVAPTVLAGVGLGLLVLGAGWLVDAAVVMATWLGISELIVGLTIVAVGTSLPELATSVLAAIRGQRDVAVGNVVGSCIFNIFGVLGAASIVSRTGLAVPPAVLSFDLIIMVAAAFACLPVFFTGNLIARWEGVVFLGTYSAYVAYLWLAATQHTLLPMFSRTMLIFVLPLVLLTLLVVAAREWQRRMTRLK